MSLLDSLGKNGIDCSRPAPPSILSTSFDHEGIRVMCYKEVLSVSTLTEARQRDCAGARADLSLSNDLSQDANAETRKMKHPLQKRPSPIQYARVGIC